MGFKVATDCGRIDHPTRDRRDDAPIHAAPATGRARKIGPEASCVLPWLKGGDADRRPCPEWAPRWPPENQTVQIELATRGPSIRGHRGRRGRLVPGVGALRRKRSRRAWTMIVSATWWARDGRILGPAHRLAARRSRPRWQPRRETFVKRSGSGKALHGRRRPLLEHKNIQLHQPRVQRNIWGGDRIVMHKRFR